MKLFPRISWMPETRIKIHAKYGGCCAYCGEPITVKDMTIDHIKARALGGTNEHSNLNPSCRRCNSFKHVFSVEEFRQELAAQVERCRRTSVNFRNAERFGLVRVVASDIVFHFERTADKSSEARDA